MPLQHGIAKGIGRQVTGTRYLSVGFLAELAGFAPRTIAKWCDQGNIKAFRIPGTGRGKPAEGERRISISDAIRFFRTNGMREVASVLLAVVKPLVAVIGLDDGLTATVNAALMPFQVSVRNYLHPIAAAADFGNRPPVAVVVGAWVGVENARQLVEQARIAAEVGGFECVAIVVHDGHLDKRSRADYTAAGIATAIRETVADVLLQFRASFPVRMENIPDVDTC